MKAIASLVLIGLLAACGGVAATPSPTPTTAPTPAPTASATKTPVAKPTYTSGDERVDSAIRDGFDEVTRFISDIGQAPDLASMVNVYREMASFAASTRLSAVALQPSPCTKPAFDLWISAVAMIEDFSQAYLDAVDSGDFSDFDENAGYDAGVKARSAIDTLNANPCG